MKRVILVAAITFFFTNCASVPNNKAQAPDIEKFTTDFCSAYREGPRDNPSQWEHCCVKHDARYWRGGTREERIAADRELETCVADTGAKKESKRMYYGVRIGGGAHWPTSYRWGYGWRQAKAYDKLTKRERAAVKGVWRESNAHIAALPEFLVDKDL
jgi:hypothetical protein